MANHLKTPNVYQIIAANQVQQANEAYQQQVNTQYNEWLKSQETQAVDANFQNNVNANYNAWLNTQQNVQPKQSSAEIPTLKSAYIAQNDKHRDYGGKIGALERTRLSNELSRANEESRKRKNQEFSGKVYKMLDNTMDTAVEMGLNPIKPTVPEGQENNIGYGVQQLDLSKYTEQLPESNNSDGVFKYMEDHPDEAYYVSKYLDEHNGQMNGIDYKKYLARQKDYEKAQSFLDPTYQMTREEEKWAQDYAKDNIKRLNSKPKKTEAEKEELRVWKDLKSKTSEATSFVMGATDEAIRMAETLDRLPFLAYPNKGIAAFGNLTKPARESFYNMWGSEPVSDFVQNQAVQNPIATGAGNFATQAALYGVTNPAIDTMVGSLGLKGAAAWGANQLGQFGQDVVLDTIPTASELMQDGSLSNEDIARLAIDAGTNIAFNAAFSVPGLVKDARAAKAASNAGAARQVDDEIKAAVDQYNAARENLENLNQQLNGLVRQNEVDALNVNPLDVDNEQFRNLMESYNNQFKDTSAMRDIYNPEDLDNALNNQLRQAMEDYYVPEMDNPRVEMEAPDIPEIEDYSNMWADALPKIEQPEKISTETENIIPNIAENTQKPKSKRKNLDLPDDVIEKASSDFYEIYDAMGKMMVDAEATQNANVMAKYEKLSKAVSDFENAVFRVESNDEVVKAKKAADAARQGFVREMKKLDPKYTGELTGTKLGNAAYRRTSMLGDAEANQALADSFINDELELREVNGDNRFARDAEPERQKVFRSPTENVPTNTGIDPDSVKVVEVPANSKRGVRYQVVSEKNEWTTPLDKTLYKTMDEANAAADGIKMNLQTFSGDTSGNTPNWKVSQAYTNTGKRGGGWNEAEYEKYTNPDAYLYESKDEIKSVEEATNMRKTEGREGFKNRALAEERLSGAEIDGLMMEWRELTEEARNLEAQGKRATTKWIESNTIFQKIQEQSTDNAQALQALAKWSRNTPEGMLVNASNIINGKVKPPTNDLKKALEKFTKSRKNEVQFSEDFVRDFLTEAEKINGLHGSQLDSREAREVMAKLGKMVNEQIPVKWNEKLQTWLMDNMLGNFRTLISRNAGGNIGLNAVEQTLQRPLAAGIDSLLSLKTGKRTQAGWRKAALKDYLSGFKKGLADELADARSGLHTARSGENTLENAISSNRRIFKSKLLNLKDQSVRHGLSVGDRPFYESVYKQTLGDYKSLYDRGLMGEEVQKLKPDEFKLYSEVAAHLNALAAVYQQDSVLSKALMGFKKDIGKLSEGALGFDILSQFSMPFVKTPANVIERAIDYSPLGFIRNTARTAREVGSKSFDQNRFANETSRNILGTALMGGGVGLASSGALSGSYSDNKDVKQAQKDANMQEHAWNVPDYIPGIGGKQLDISWIPVLGSNLVASDAAYEGFQNGNGDLINSLAKGAEAGGRAIFDQSMFQGLQRLFGSSDAYNSDKGIVGNIGDTVKSGLGQFIPSLVRQSAQVKDEYQRDLPYSNKGTTFGILDAYDINNLANNIPGLREEYLAPKVDSQGNLVKENQGRSIGMKVLEDMFLPGKLTDVKENRLTEEAKRLSDITTNNKAYMPKADRQYIDTEEHTLTNQEWTDYQQKYYKAMDKAGNKLLDSDYYKGLDDSQKEVALDNLYGAIRSAINSEYNGKEVSGAANAYKEAGGGDKGTDAIINYYRSKQIKADNNISTNSKVGKAIDEAVQKGDIKAAETLAEEAKQEKEQKAEVKATLSDYGLDKTSATTAYTKAQKVDPDVSVDQFAKKFKTIDVDGSQGIKQDELIDYFNKYKISNADVEKTWKLYGSDKWQYKPVYDAEKKKWVKKHK